MRWVRFSVLVIFITIIQAGVFAKFDVKPDILLILLVFFSVYSNTREAIITSFVIGFCADLIGNVMGPGILSYTIFGTILAYMHRVIAIRKIHHQVISIFLTGLFAGIFTALLALLKSQDFNVELIKTIFWISICSSIVGPFLFPPFTWWMRIKPDRYSRR